MDPYIADILRQVDEVIKLFSMEKELRKVRNRGDRTEGTKTHTHRHKNRKHQR